jgi:3-deoxy-D-manno-octulosonate 8-phosphate phosphatase (KDO 8-P phosphatase)
MTDAAEITLLVLDVDGVMTDGSVVLDAAGGEIKRFHVRDGLGLKLWIDAGFDTGVISGRSSTAVERRMAEIGVRHVRQGVSDKRGALLAMCESLRIDPVNSAFIGDDLPDLPAMGACGYPMSVADADPRVRKLAGFVTTLGGGRGAVREAVEHLLDSKGLLQQTLSRYHTGL